MSESSRRTMSPSERATPEFVACAEARPPGSGGTIFAFAGRSSGRRNGGSEPSSTTTTSSSPAG